MMWLIILVFSLVVLAIVFSTVSKRPYNSSAGDFGSDVSFVAATSPASSSGKGSYGDPGSDSGSEGGDGGGEFILTL